MQDFDDGLIVLSNSEPYEHKYSDDGIEAEAAVSGLTSALDSVLQRRGGAWVAWGRAEADHEVTDEDGRIEVPPGDESYTLTRLDLSEHEVEKHYEGFCNRVLWPMCHGLLDKLYMRRAYWSFYAKVNRRFADAALAEASGDEVIWTHDYHFALVPKMLRDETDAYLAHFWHIPWPEVSVFEKCPHNLKILEGLLGNDEIGFHTERYRQNFLDAVRELTDLAVIGNDVMMNDHTVTVDVEPIGVDVSAFEKVRESSVTEMKKSLRERYSVHTETVLLGVERIDYMKGIPRRLNAIEALLEERPKLRGEVTYVQKGSVSRTGIPEYREEIDKVNDLMDQINDRFGTEDWQPVVPIDDYLSNEELAALYNMGDVMLVTSLVDGMNLVSQEYAAAGPEDGTLVLSDYAGSSELFGDLVYQVNPYDTPALSDTIERAIEDDSSIEPLRERAAENDINRWYGGLFEN